MGLAVPRAGVALSPDCPQGRALTAHLCLSPGETIQGLRNSLRDAIDTLSRVDSSVAVSSGGELFLRFISLTSLEYSVRAARSAPPLLLLLLLELELEPPAAHRPSRSFPGLLQVQGDHDRARGDLPGQSVSLEE